MTLGITGTYCAGKSTAADILRERGYQRIDVDRLGHLALDAQRKRVIERFGPTIAGSDGTIDRRALGRIVFADRRALSDLESISHPYMVRLVEEQVAGDGRWIIDAAILFRLRLHRFCRTVLIVDAWRVLRFLRAYRRDSSGLRSTWARLRAQQDVLKPPADPVDIYIVSNNTTRSALSRRLGVLLDAIDEPV